MMNFAVHKKVIYNIVIFSIFVYFVFHAIYGQRGIISYFTLSTELAKSYELLEEMKSERLEIENRTKLLRPSSLDKDMLDEKVRNVLGFSDANEKLFNSKVSD